MRKKIKLAMVTASFSINGISAVIMNYCRYMDLDRFDITIMAGIPVDSSYKEECERKGICILELPSNKQDSGRYYRALWEALSNGYDIAHIHGNSAVIAAELFLAYMRGIGIRIAHCHNTSCGHIYLHHLLKPVFHALYTEGFSCSLPAGKWLFQKRKFSIIPNAFDTEKFRFRNEDRLEIREQLHIQNGFLIGHIGRFNKAKNHTFILEVFRKAAEKNPDAYLILVGDGPDFEKIEGQIREHPFRSRIIIYGETQEPEKIYAAMDVFLFPSQHEGLGIVLVEAQISGLPCVVSDVVPREVLLGEQVTLLSLNDDLTLWSNAVMRSKACNRERFYEENVEAIKKYEIVGNVHNLENLYLSFLKDKHNRL